MNPVTLLLVLATLPSATGPSATLLSEVKLSDTLFTKLDRNQDHKVTTDEIAESQRAFFRRALRVADRNEDGALSSEELTVALTDAKPVQLPSVKVTDRFAGMNFKQFDKNGDGKIDPDELPPRLKKLAKQIDSNGDGKIVAAELAAAMKRRDGKK